MNETLKLVTLTALSSFFAASPLTASAQTCAGSAGPDVVVGDLTGWSRYGTVGEISGYTFGTTSCNYGKQVLPWNGTSSQHPVIAMNAYRLKNGRFEQIGMSWVKHGWAASAENFCCTCENPNNSQVLGVGCSDPYDSNTNGLQAGFNFNGQLVSGLGPRSDINASTGVFAFPYTTQGLSGNAIYKRLQIHVSDLDPAQNAGALYFAEGLYITPADSGANAFNNASYRSFTVGSMVSGAYSLSFSGSAPTNRTKPAIMAWRDTDPSVLISTATLLQDGIFHLGSKCTDNHDGTWHYEFALYNMNSNTSAGAFSIPVPSGVNVTNIGFHDVDYHSGEIYDGADWPGQLASGALTWATTPFASNPNANALRWGTMYNFRFDADSPPKSVTATGSMFRNSGTFSFASYGPRKPGDVDNDNAVNVADLLSVINAWGRCPAQPTPCPADIAPPGGDGQVNVNDLLAVVNNWG